MIYNFREFPGSIVNDEYVFNKLYSVNSKGKELYWIINVRLIDSSSVLSSYTHDWDMKAEKVIKLTDNYFDSSTSTEGVLAQIYTIRGEINGKIARPPPTNITTGSIGLKGKKNERNAFTQALIHARAQYNKKMSEGYSTSKKTNNKLWYAMAANKFDDSYDSYPCYSQPKLDGCRCIVGLEDGSIIKYSRDLNIWKGYEIFDKYLEPILLTGVKLDGELYKHGVPLQTIVGVARNSVKTIQLEYHIFDAFWPGQKYPTEDRLIWLSALKFPEESYIKIVPSTRVENRTELDKLYNQYIKDGYEGQMVREIDALYETSLVRELRSSHLLKRKKKYDAEFELVSVEQGTCGIAKGSFIGIFVTDNGLQFKATFKDTDFKTSKEYYKSYLENPNEWLGRKYTIEYDALSKDNKPLRPKIKALREVL